MIRPPNSEWRCIGIHPEGNMWAVEIPTGVLIRFTYSIPREGFLPMEGHSITFVPGLQILNDEDGGVAYLVVLP